MKNNIPKTLTIKPEGDTGIIAGIHGNPELEDVKHVEKLIIADGATAIAKNMFFPRWESLTDIYIPSSITELYHGSFRGCENLTVHCFEGSYAHSFFSGLERVEAFKIAVDKLCAEYDVTIVHEDVEGGFQILPYYNSGLANWFLSASHADWRQDDWLGNRTHPKPCADKDRTHKRIEFIG
jgi:hypothetical protein